MLGAGASACATKATPSPLDAVASTYVELANALMQQDPQAASGDTVVQVTAHVGSSEASGPYGSPDIAAAATDALRQLDALPSSAGPDPRRRWLRVQLGAIAARARQQQGATLSVEDELAQFYDAPLATTNHADASASVRQQLERLLPGSGDGAGRLAALEADVVVPGPRLPAVFERALTECRVRTRLRFALPQNESVTVKYVVGEPWSGFSAYEGGGRSTVSVNTAYPLTVDRVLQLACHEGYPGHHAINLLRESQARRGRPELAAVPLFTADAFETEALATRATALVFSDAERTAFERDVLFPLAGLDASLAERHVAVAVLIDRLAPSIGLVLGRYLAGGLGFVEANWLLQQDALMQHPAATLEFARLYRGFSLAYTGAARSDAGIASEWLRTAGFPVEPVIILSDGHNSPTRSHGR